MASKQDKSYYDKLEKERMDKMHDKMVKENYERMEQEMYDEFDEEMAELYDRPLYPNPDDMGIPEDNKIFGIDPSLPVNAEVEKIKKEERIREKSDAYKTDYAKFVEDDMRKGGSEQDNKTLNGKQVKRTPNVDGQSTNAQDLDFGE